jgi:hypothetical protein
MEEKSGNGPNPLILPKFLWHQRFSGEKSNGLEMRIKESEIWMEP